MPRTLRKRPALPEIDPVESTSKSVKTNVKQSARAKIEPPNENPLNMNCILHALADSLHPSRMPANMPCREDEQEIIEGFLKHGIRKGQAGCIHISGSPGIGKTAVVSTVLHRIKQWANDNKCPIPGVQFINGMTIGLTSTDFFNALYDGMVSSEGALASTSSTPSQSKQKNGSVSLRESFDHLNKLVSSVMEDSPLAGLSLNNTPLSSNGSALKQHQSLQSPPSTGLMKSNKSTGTSMMSKTPNSTNFLMYSKQNFLGAYSQAGSGMRPLSNLSSMTPQMKSPMPSSVDKSVAFATPMKDDKCRSNDTSSNSTPDFGSVNAFVPNGIVHGPKARMHIIVVDESDALLNRSREALYRLFLWSQVPGGRVLVISIANDITMTERALPRLRIRGMSPSILVFKPYTPLQIENIVIDRLTRVTKVFLPLMFPDIDPETLAIAQLQHQALIDRKAIQLMAKRLASMDGDLRKALAVLRQCVLNARMSYCGKFCQGDFGVSMSASSLEKASSSSNDQGPWKESPNTLLSPGNPTNIRSSASFPTSGTGFMSPVAGAAEDPLNVSSSTELQTPSPGSLLSPTSTTSSNFEGNGGMIPLAEPFDSVSDTKSSTDVSSPAQDQSGSIFHNDNMNRCECWREGHPWCLNPDGTPKAGFAVSVMQLSKELNTSLDRNKCVKVLENLPRDCQLLVCVIRGLAERLARDRGRDRLYELSKLDAGESANSGTFEGAGLNFASLATTMGIFNNVSNSIVKDGENGNKLASVNINKEFERERGREHGLFNAHGVSVIDESAAHAEMVSVELLFETFRNVCKKKIMNVVIASGFVDLLDRLETSGVIQTIHKNQSKSARFSTAASITTSPQWWLKSSIRLSITSDDLDTAFEHKGFFSSIRNDVKSGLF